MSGFLPDIVRLARRQRSLPEPTGDLTRTALSSMIVHLALLLPATVTLAQGVMVSNLPITKHLNPLHLQAGTALLTVLTLLLVQRVTRDAGKHLSAPRPADRSPQVQRALLLTSAAQLLSLITLPGVRDLPGLWSEIGPWVTLIVLSGLSTFTAALGLGASLRDSAAPATAAPTGET